MLRSALFSQGAAKGRQSTATAIATTHLITTVIIITRAAAPKRGAIGSCDSPIRCYSSVVDDTSAPAHNDNQGRRKALCIQAHVLWKDDDDDDDEDEDTFCLQGACASPDLYDDGGEEMGETKTSAEIL